MKISRARAKILQKLNPDLPGLSIPNGWKSMYDDEYGRKMTELINRLKNDPAQGTAFLDTLRKVINPGNKSLHSASFCRILSTVCCSIFNETKLSINFKI